MHGEKRVGFPPRRCPFRRPLEAITKAKSSLTARPLDGDGREGDFCMSRGQTGAYGECRSLVALVVLAMMSVSRNDTPRGPRQCPLHFNPAFRQEGTESGCASSIARQKLLVARRAISILPVCKDFYDMPHISRPKVKPLTVFVSEGRPRQHEDRFLRNERKRDTGTSRTVAKKYKDLRCHRMTKNVTTRY